jgi:exodeoxyribonuclease V alpha subunit
MSMTWLFEPGRPWRPVDAALAAAIRRRWPETPDDLLRLFAMVNVLTGQGHSALDPASIESAAVMGLPDWPAERWQALLAGCPAVGTSGDTGTPFVFDRGLLYLRRFYRDEVRLAEGLRALSRWSPVPAEPGLVAAALDHLFPDVRDAIDDRQVRACLLSLASRLTVVLGGPGTGKTTTVLRLLALHQSLSPTPLRIAVAAPTGKAAARVMEAMRVAADRTGLDAVLRERLPHRAWTLHRLLGASADGARFRHDRDHPLDVDLVVLDEASMVDLGLFARLIDALPGHARLVVLGDPEQLEAIESGPVLTELARLDDRASQGQTAHRAMTVLDSTAAPDESAAVGACIVRLVRPWRFAADSGIGMFSAAVRAGDAGAAQSILRDGNPGLEGIEATGGGASTAIQSFVVERYRSAMAGGNPATMLAAHRNYRVLAATRLQAGHANASVATALGQRAREMFPESGLPFLVERNDALRRLHNGDTGVFATGRTGEGLYAWFDAESIDDGDALRSMQPYELGRWQPAYAMTVHRAQGSEYEDVMVILPNSATPVASRAWLYTAVTRARLSLTVVGDPAQLAGILANLTVLKTRLSDRLLSVDEG